VTRTQLMLESTVAQTPPPTIGTTVGDDGTVTLALTYADAPTGQTSLLTFSL
jgi:hypothetical protein